MDELSKIEDNNGINYFRTLWEEQFNKLYKEINDMKRLCKQKNYTCLLGRTIPFILHEKGYKSPSF